jgi:hypothetical protein
MIMINFLDISLKQEIQNNKKLKKITIKFQA